MQVKPRTGRIPATLPNWRERVRATYEFKTSVVTSYDGTEQRAALRERARLGLSFDAVLTQEGIQRHAADLASGQDALFVVPARWRYVPLAASASPGATVITLDEVPFWAVSGARLVISGATEEAVRIASVAGFTVTLTDALVGSFPSGARVYHAYAARAEAEVQFDAQTDRLWQGSVTYEVDPGSDPQAAPPLDPEQFEGRDLFLEKPNWRSSPRIEMQSSRRQFDSGRGLVAVDNPVPRHTRVDQLSFLRSTAETVENLVAFFLRQKGKRTSFWAPTWQADITPRVTASAGATTLEVAGTAFLAAYAGSDLYNVVFVDFGEGVRQVNRIASVVAISGGNTRLNMASPWEQPVTPATRVSWCLRRRFATDRLEVNWITSRVAEAQMSLYSLPNGAP